MRRHRPAAGLAVALAAAAAAAPASAATPAAAGRLHLGTATLHRCADDHAWSCGTLRRRLDPTDARGPRLAVGFRWHPATSGRSSGPALVAVEGGPGFPSVGSAIEYTGIYGPLLRTRALLLVDDRGTGTSALIDCPRLQRYPGVTSTVAFAGRVARCARRIDRRYAGRLRPGRHAANLFATAYAVDDLAAVLRRLRLGRVDLYGDSYGTWFAQSLMARHPDALRSVVLDSAYPVRGLDPWYASSGATWRDALEAVCARDRGCAAAAGPTGAAARLGALLDRVRAAPITGPTRMADGQATTARVDARVLVDLVQDAGSDPVVYRELDPAVRAALAGDPVALLRLAAQAAGGTDAASYFSDGLYFAVACTDYPQLFSLRSAPGARRAELAASILRGPGGAFAPFTVPEALTMSAYSEPYRACLEWPRVTDVPTPVPAGAPRLPAAVPLLVIGGDLDSLTPLRDARELAPTLAEHTRVVELRNTVHVTSEGDTLLAEGAACGRRIIRAFVRDPAALDRIDASCAAAVPPVHTAGAYPRRLADAAAATLTAGRDPGLDARRAATVAAGALADVTIRRSWGGAARGPGLRGGRFTARGDARQRLRLVGARFTEDTAVAGTGHWVPARGAVDGRLRVRLPGGRVVAVALAWTQRTPMARARVAAATLELPAP